MWICTLPAVEQRNMSFFTKLQVYMEDVHNAFDKMWKQDLVLWNTLIVGYAQTGYCNDVEEQCRQQH